MPPRPARYGRLVKSRRFLFSVGPLVLSLMFAFAFVVVGVFDQTAGLVGSQERPTEATMAYGEGGTPPLTAADRLTALLSRLPVDAASIVGSPPPMVDLLPGVRGVNYAAQCSEQPAGQMERAGPIRHITVHTSEESAGVAGADAVCRYGNQLYGRMFYNWYIFSTGQVWQTLPEGVKPWAEITRNTGDVAIVLQGRANVDAPTDAQLDALRRLVAALAAKYGLSADDLYGHRDWSRIDATDPNVPDSLKNNHTDPGRSWDADHWGLADAVAAAGSTPTPPPATVTPTPTERPVPTSALPTAPATRTPWPTVTPTIAAPTGLGSYLVPALDIRARFDGSVTYYNPTGHPTASGKVYDGATHIGAVWLVTRDQLADDDPRVKDCHDSPSLHATVCPALPFGTAVRICRKDQPGRCTRIATEDTGLMPSGGVDLSPLAFSELGSLSAGRFPVTVTIVGYLRP